MIPNTLAITGLRAKAWSHLKSIEHALSRALDPNISQLSELDRERLAALASELKRWKESPPPVSDTPLSLLEEAATPNLLHHVLVDARSTIKNVEEFDNWKKGSKVGYDRKVASLSEALDQFLADSTESLYTKSAPQAELRVLHQIVRSLLRDAESAIGSERRW